MDWKPTMAVACGNSHTCFVSEDGESVWTMGCGSVGCLGHGAAAHERLPRRIARPDHGASGFSVSGDRTYKRAWLRARVRRCTLQCCHVLTNFPWQLFLRASGESVTRVCRVSRARWAPVDTSRCRLW